MGSSIHASLRELRDPQHSILPGWPPNLSLELACDICAPLTFLQEVWTMALLGLSPSLLLQSQAQLLLLLSFLLCHLLLLLEQR